MTEPVAPISRETFFQTAPAVLNALLALGKAVDDSGLDKALTELIKLRVSQLNGCAFCVQMHAALCRKLNIDSAKLDLLAVWRDTDLFTPREKAALGWAEMATRITPESESAAAYAALRGLFSEQETVFLTAAIANINAWNRIAAPLHFTPLT